MERHTVAPIMPLILWNEAQATSMSALAWRRLCAPSSCFRVAKNDTGGLPQHCNHGKMVLVATRDSHALTSDVPCLLLFQKAACLRESHLQSCYKWQLHNSMNSVLPTAAGLELSKEHSVFSQKCCGGFGSDGEELLVLHEAIRSIES